MSEIKDPISFVEAEKIIAKDINRIKKLFSDKASNKKRVYKIRSFLTKKIWCSLGENGFKRSYADGVNDIKDYVRELKKKKCFIKCKEVFPIFVCCSSLGNYVNLKIIFHTYE